MLDNNLTLETAEATQKMLKGLIASTKKSHWINIMDEIVEAFPFLLQGEGRPSDSAIQSTDIAAVGASSWKEYVNEYLNWKIETWNTWRKAYILVLKYSYLRQLNLSVGAINEMLRWCKKHEIGFPENSELWKYNCTLKKNDSTKKDVKEMSPDSKDHVLEKKNPTAKIGDGLKIMAITQAIGQQNHSNQATRIHALELQNEELHRQSIKIHEQNYRLHEEKKKWMFTAKKMAMKIDRQNRLVSEVIKELLDAGLSRQAHNLRRNIGATKYSKSSQSGYHIDVSKIE